MSLTRDPWLLIPGAVLLAGAAVALIALWLRWPPARHTHEYLQVPGNRLPHPIFDLTTDEITYGRVYEVLRRLDDEPDLRRHPPQPVEPAARRYDPH